MKLRLRHMIRNLVIRNRDSRRPLFLNFPARVKELVNTDCRFGFCMKNYIYSQLDFDTRIRHVQSLVRKNVFSYGMSPPYVKSMKAYTPLTYLSLLLCEGRKKVGNNCNCNIQNLYSTGEIDKSG